MNPRTTSNAEDSQDAPSSFKASLEGANVHGANLGEANLWVVQGLTREQIERVIRDGDIVLPRNLRAPPSWGKGANEHGEEAWEGSF